MAPAPGIGQTDSTSAFLGKILIARLDPYAAEIKAIGIPARLNGRVRADFAAAVMTDGVSQSVDLCWPQVKEPALKGASVIRATRPMANILPLVLALTVVQEREEFDDE